jgi:hypothetical protein
MSRPVVILERLNWRPASRGWLLLPGADRVEAFADRAEAEANLREHEWNLRRRINPFRCGGPFLHFQSGFDAARLHDWFLDVGLESPGAIPDSNAWAELWDRDHTAMSEAQRAVAWEALDRVRFFRLSEGTSGLSMHLVARPHYEEDPIARPYGSVRYVGATPYMLVRSTQTADELCHALFIDGVFESGGYVGAQAAQHRWSASETDPFAAGSTETSSWPSWHAEHRPLMLFTDREPTPGQSLYVVLRRHWRLEVPDDGSWRWCLTSARPCGRALAAFDTLAAADAHIAGLEAEAQTYPSPFRFGPPHEWGPFNASTICGTLSNMHPVDFANLWNMYQAQDSMWSRWWDEAVPVLTPDNVLVAWSLYENLRFYEVVEVEFRE